MYVMIVTLVFKKIADMFAGKSLKIAKKCYHNIDPRPDFFAPPYVGEKVRLASSHMKKNVREFAKKMRHRIENDREFAKNCVIEQKMTANSRKIASSKKCPRIREKTNDVLN
jgi:hypothetical protein